MKYLKFFISPLERNSIAISNIKSLIPKKIRTKAYRFINKESSIRLYFDNNTITIDSKNTITIDPKNRSLKGLMPVYYWDDTPNFGDLIGPYLISKITGKPVLNIRNLQYSGIMSVGSIIHNLNRKDMVIWGSGMMYELTDGQKKNYKKYNPEILSVRGNLTAKHLLEVGMSIPNQSAYGDPALILPLFYKPSITGPKKIGICPHYSHKTYFLENITDRSNLKLIDVQKDVETVVNSISSSSVCISTSLHGLIVAQAYGIPWVWLEIIDNNLTGNDFKFRNFFSTIDESKVSHIRTTMEEIKNVNFEAIAEEATLPNKLYNEELILKSLIEYLDREEKL